MSALRVVQLLTQSTGGPADHGADVAVELHRRGVEVVLVLPDGPAARRAEAAGVPRIGTAPSSARDVRGTRELVRRLRALRPDVVHCQDRRAGLVGRPVGRALGARTAYTLHGVPDSLSDLVAGNAQVAPRRRGDRLRYLAAERLLAHLGDVLVVPTHALADYVAEHVGIPRGRLRVVPNGVDPQRFRPRPRGTGGGLTVAWAGAMVPTKGLSVLLEALARVDGVRVVLAGEGELAGDLRRRQAALGLHHRVSWLGWVEDPAAVLGGADVVAVPSLAENQPLVLLQGMASGAACIATTVGGVPETVRDGVDGLLVPPGDAGALAAALSRVRDDGALRDRLGRSARAAVLDRFSLAGTVDRLLDVYA